MTVLKRLKSFNPFVNSRSRVLILGSMPGPVALKRRQFYGFDGNHFWKIMPMIFQEEFKVNYLDKLDLMRRHRVALWDVLESCTREGALDSRIRDVKVNKIPELLKKYRSIRAIFVNGRFAHQLFMKSFGGKIDRPVFYLPSTSPAHAAMTMKEKRQKWSAIKKFL